VPAGCLRLVKMRKRYVRATVGLLHLTVTLCWVVSVPDTAWGGRIKSTFELSSQNVIMHRVWLGTL